MENWILGGIILAACLYLARLVYSAGRKGTCCGCGTCHNDKGCPHHDPTHDPAACAAARAGTHADVPAMLHGLTPLTPVTPASPSASDGAEPAHVVSDKPAPAAARNAGTQH